MNKITLLLNIILFVLVSVGNYFYTTTWDIVIKGLTSLGFVLIGLINMIYALKNKVDNKKFIFILFIGLVAAMLGDIALEYDFVIGALLFALGHIGFLISYCFIDKMKLKDLIYSAIFFVFAGSFILFYPKISFAESYMQIVCFVYAAIISLMIGKAISNLINKNNFVNLLLVIGSGLFFFSDFMLLINWFVKKEAWSSYLCMATYYPALCILAHTIFHSAKKGELK